MFRALLTFNLCSLVLTAGFTACGDRQNPYWPRHVIAEGYVAQTVAAADFNGDQRLDVISSGDWQTRLYLAPDWKEVLVDPPELGKQGGRWAYHSEIVDVDADGDPDYIAAYSRPPLIFWLENPGDPLKLPWEFHLIDDRAVGVHGLKAGDIDGDGRAELFANSSLPEGVYPESLVWYRIPQQPRSADRWESHVLADGDAPGRSHYLDLEDINKDGRKDVATGAKGPSKGSWFAWWEAPEDPTRTWKKHVIDSNQLGATNILITDINYDGEQDVVVSRGHDSGVFWYEGPSWKRHNIDDSIRGPHSLAIGDIDGDGYTDVATCGKDDRVVRWYENDGEGKFVTHHVYADQSGYDMRLVDLDQDNDLDILIAGDKSKNVCWYENRVVAVTSVAKLMPKRTEP